MTEVHPMTEERQSFSTSVARRLPLATACLTLLALVACSGPNAAPDAPPPAQNQGPKIEVQDVHVNLLPDSGAVYLTIVNSGSEDDRLLRVETPLATTAESHETVDENGVLRMASRPDGFVVPAGGQLQLAPGGKHIMLLGLHPPGQEAAETSTVTLYFENSGSIQVDGHVMRPTAGSQAGTGGDAEHHHDH